jgi:hypothetical protein
MIRGEQIRSVAIDGLQTRREAQAILDVVANGTRLYYELSGIGEPLVLVHGSWADATVWQLVVSGLSEHFRVLT